ncbi:MAG: L,D-transpeptidase family protein [Nitrospirota bacterium]
MKFRTIPAVVISLLLIAASAVSAGTYSYGKDLTIIGAHTTYKVKDGESLIEIARKFDLGYNEIVDANPLLDPFVPDTGAFLHIPALWILPDVKQYEGIVINISEMRLYLFPVRGKGGPVRTFPIGIGSEGNETPLGNFKVIEKIARPHWHPPESIRKERPELPEVVPPGPENPLGSHALRLSMNTILIHGTNKPWGIGRMVSHGCIRLYPEDIPRLFRLAPEGTRVTIVRQPIKIGTASNKVYIEVHLDRDLMGFNYHSDAVRLLLKKGLLKKIDTEKLYRAIEEKSGIPVIISD